MNCRFCAQSGHYETDAPTYPFLPAKTIETASRTFWDRGVHRVGWVASGCAVGEDDVKKIAEISTESNASSRRCASLGQLDKNSLQKLKASGISRYHHNLETSSNFYREICTTQRWQDRFETICRAKEIGLEVCCGGLFGLGETWDDRVDLALSLRFLEVDSVPINFFSPIPGTPLGNRPLLDADEALRIIAMFRILMPRTSIRVCGGRPQTLGKRQTELFDAGADALMTGDYLTTSGCTVENDLEMIQNAGLNLTGRSGISDK